MRSKMAIQEISPAGSVLSVSGNKGGDNVGAGSDSGWSQARCLLPGRGQKAVVPGTQYMNAYSYIRKGQA